MLPIVKLYPIVTSPKLESGAVILLSNNEDMLDDEEEKAISRLQNDPFDIQPSTNDEPVSSFLNNNKSPGKKANQGLYIECSFIAATSVSVKRVLGSAGWLLTNLSKSISPITF